MIRELDLHYTPFPSSSSSTSYSYSTSSESTSEIPKRSFYLNFFLYIFIFMFFNCLIRFLSTPQTAISFTLQDIIQDPPEQFKPLIQTISIQAEVSGVLHCIALWYEIHLKDSSNIEDIIDTGPINNDHNHNHNNHQNTSTYWRQIAFLIENPKDINKNEIININIIIDRGSGIWCNIIS